MKMDQLQSFQSFPIRLKLHWLELLYNKFTHKIEQNNAV